MNEYEKQAQEFLTKTGTEFKAEFLRHGRYFIDDTDTRDIYRITLTKGSQVYVFNFGQSIQHSGKDYSEPTAYDVLACLTKYDPGSFEDFCGDYGYDTDSRKAEKAYHEVLNEFKSLERLYNSAELELMQEIQ